MSSQRNNPEAWAEAFLSSLPAGEPPQLTEAGLERHLENNFPLLSERARAQGITIAELVRRTIKDINSGGLN